MYGADPTSHNAAGYPHFMPLADDHGYGSRPPPAGYGHPGHQAYAHAGGLPGASSLWGAGPAAYPQYEPSSHLSQFPGLGGGPYGAGAYGAGLPPAVGYGAKPHYGDPWSTPQLDAAAQRALEDAIARGRLLPHDLDPAILTKLAMETPQTQYSVMEKFLASRDLTVVRNKTGWLAGIMKRCLNELTPPDLSVLPGSVRMRIDQAGREGRISLDQFDHKCFEELGKLHESVQLQCVDGLLESRLQNVKNPTGFFLGIIKRKRDESSQMAGAAGVPQPFIGANPVPSLFTVQPQAAPAARYPQGFAMPAPGP